MSRRKRSPVAAADLEPESNAGRLRTIRVECHHLGQPTRTWRVPVALTPWPADHDWTRVQLVLFVLDPRQASDCLDLRHGKFRWHCEMCGTDVELSLINAEHQFLEIVRSGAASVDLRTLAGTVGAQ